MATKAAAAAKANAEKTKAERAEDARWRTCPGYSPLQRRVIKVDGTIVLCDHRSWNGQEMVFCRRSGQPPQAQNAPPPTVLTN